MQRFLIAAVLTFTVTPALAWDFCWPSCSTALPLNDQTVVVTGTGRGVLFSGEAVPELMERASRETLARGFTHLTLTSGDAGNQYLLNFGAYGGYNMVGNARAVVHMMNATEARSVGGIDARQALAKYIDE